MSFEGNYYEACKRIGELEAALREIEGLARWPENHAPERICAIAQYALGSTPETKGDGNG